jgi:hypothetical protein
VQRIKGGKRFQNMTILANASAALGLFDGAGCCSFAMVGDDVRLVQRLLHQVAFADSEHYEFSLPQLAPSGPVTTIGTGTEVLSTKVKMRLALCNG